MRDLDSSQGAKWDGLEPLFHQLLVGDYETSRIGLGDPENARNWLIRDLGTQYGLEAQRPELGRIADAYLEEARRILERYGPAGTTLDPSRRDTLERELADLQSRQEGDILRLLGPDRERVAAGVARIITFDWGEGYRGNSEVIGGF